MKTQFGSDSKRENYEALIKVITIIIFTIVLSVDIFEVFGGRKTWVEALESDWAFILLLVSSFAWPYALYAALVVLPIVVWGQLRGQPLSWDAIIQASWSVWVPTALWLFYLAFFVVLVLTGKLFSKHSKALKL